MQISANGAKEFMQVYAVSDIGLIRGSNQDAFFCDQEKGLFLIADGMGGYSGGEIASRIAVDVFRDHFVAIGEDGFCAEIGDLIRLANEEICAASQRDESLHNMGTTLLVLATDKKKIHLAHVGDCRAYLLRGNKITQLTSDHNVSGEMLRDGQLTEKEAMHHPGKNLLTRALGRHAMLRVDFIEHDLKKNDYIFLCSDGLTGLVESEEIRQAIKECGGDLENTCRFLLDIALSRGGDDNITMILLKNC